MATLTVQTIVLAAITPTYAAAAAGGDAFANNGKTFFHVKNGGAGSINVTVNSQVNCDQGFDHDQVVAVANGAEKMIGPFPTNRFNDTSSPPLVQITYSAVTSVTVAAFTV